MKKKMTKEERLAKHLERIKKHSKDGELGGAYFGSGKEKKKEKSKNEH